MAGLVLASVVLLIGACSSEPSGSFGISSSLGSDEQELLDLHNRHREAHCAPPLEWSETLAVTTREWSETLAVTCRMRHGESPYGENLFQGTKGSFGPKDVISTWYDEAARYDYRSPGFSSQTGHFSQIVWQASERLGCARSSCRGMDLWVCRYDPPGNVRGSFEENVAPPSCQD